MVKFIVPPEETAPEFELTPAEQAKKQGRHVVVALRHLNKQRESLIEKRDRLSEEIVDIEQAITALG